LLKRQNQKRFKGDGTNIGDINLSTCGSSAGTGTAGATSSGTSVSLLPGKARFGFAVLQFDNPISFKSSINII
jgi:hypothetical protein